MKALAVLLILTLVVSVAIAVGVALYLSALSAGILPTVGVGAIFLAAVCFFGLMILDDMGYSKYTRD